MNPKADKPRHDAHRERRGPDCESENYRNLLLDPMRGEKGAVLVISIILLALLTFLGIAALNTTTTEIQVSGNDKVYKQAFYNADAGVSYAVQRGLALFPAAAPGTLTNLASQPGGLTSDVVLQYMEIGGSPRRVQIWSTGTAPGGGRSVIIAGLVATATSPQTGPTNPPTGQ